MTSNTAVDAVVPTTQAADGGALVEPGLGVCSGDLAHLHPAIRDLARADDATRHQAIRSKRWITHPLAARVLTALEETFTQPKDDRMEKPPAGRGVRDGEDHVAAQVCRCGKPRPLIALNSAACWSSDPAASPCRSAGHWSAPQRPRSTPGRSASTCLVWRIPRFGVDSGYPIAARPGCVRPR